MTKSFGVKELITRIRDITRSATHIQLSRRNLKVLRILHDRRGKVVDRNQLADEVWGRDYFPESRALDPTSPSTTKGLKRPPVHGAGYRFE